MARVKCECGCFFEDEGFRKVCFQCFNLKRYREATKLQDSTNSLGKSDSERAESKPPNSVTPTAEAKTTGFECEARLLESKKLMASLWLWANKLEPKPAGEQAASIAATVFIDITKEKRFDRIKR
jgi:hypothetical protein